MKILVPVDGSEQSIKALEYAINLLKLTDPKSNSSREIIIVNVLPHFHIPLGFEKPMKSIKTGNTIPLSEYIAEMNELLKTEWEEKLSEIKNKFADSGVLVQTQLLEGSHSSRTIADSIVKFSTQVQVDLIVVGNVGLGGISKIKALGSVSRNLVETSNRPVLVVH
ncbi:universal stress protein [Candidatus Nitrosocosmicus hydrocola]|jgi:nucleotide-binding universal stress UspA family protein|uniref:universal stress protein n=1 Tax=Candidatus Nitrosocosmicus hydrocola TaxID=1826872 RepID=UPI0011E5A4C3|nr:universal stress protein [Candidatus Nitrosocosmicus hydrocola]